MEIVDKEKLCYDLAIAFATAEANAAFRDGEQASDIAANMPFSFRHAYRKYITQPNEIFNMRKCLFNEDSLD